MRGVPSGPSKVIHVKGVPSDTQDNELVQLVGSFGTTVRTLVLGPKHQAFIEVESLEAAGKLLSHYSNVQAFIRTTPVYLQYSSRTEITPNTRYANGGDGSISAGEGNPTLVLMVSVANMRLPVTLDNLHQVFRTFGDVLRIGTLTTTYTTPSLTAYCALLTIYLVYFISRHINMNTHTQTPFLHFTHTHIFFVPCLCLFSSPLLSPAPPLIPFFLAFLSSYLLFR